MSEPKTLDEQLTAALADAKAAQELATQAQTALDAKATELAAAKAENEASATALAAMTTERDALKASVTASNAESEKQKALAGQLASELATIKASVASNPAFAHAGAGRAAIESNGVKAGPNSMTFAQFKSLSQSERMAFSVRGGRITD